MRMDRRAVAAVFSVVAVLAGSPASAGAVRPPAEEAEPLGELGDDVRVARIAGADAAVLPVAVGSRRAVMLQVVAEAGGEPAVSVEAGAEAGAASAALAADGDSGAGGLGGDLDVANTLDPAGDNYRGGRGLITLQGMTGMFLNPTSGTIDQGQLTIQYCVLFNDYSTDLVGHGLMIDYGVTDWLNVGGFGTIADPEGVDVFDSEPIVAGGPFVRARLVKEQDETWVPELSVGAIYLDGPKNGDAPFYKAEGFVAASKGFDIDPDGFLREVRGHLGARGLLRDEAPAPADDEAYLYGGLELYLPYAISLIGEVSTANVVEDADDNIPYAFGVQWKPNGVLGLSAAHMNPGGGFDKSFWFGVGLNFDF